MMHDESNLHSFVPNKTHVCVLGLGYIGLPTASILATRGYHVYGTDIRKEVVETINRGKIHIEEPDLDMLVRSAVQSGQLRAGEQPEEADVFILCVPTPIRADRGPDLSFVSQACDAIKPFVRPGNLIILESTSPPRTTDELVLRRAIPAGMVVGKDVFVAHCPERVLPGRILMEVVQNDRIVGGITDSCSERAKAFYESFVRGEVLATSALVAETTKLIENAYRDVNIAFANELSIVADHLGIDPWEVIELANRHPRVNILQPGPGVGGHCISVDPWFLVHAAPHATSLIRTAREVNDSKPRHVVDRVLRLAKQFQRPTIGCLGLTYKADVDDLRESPALEITQSIQASNIGDVLVCDPHVSPARVPELKLVSLDDLVRQSQILVLLTDHRVFRKIPRQVLQERVIVDTRGVWR